MDVLKNAYEITKNWSNEYVKALVTKLVHRNKITEKFKNSKIEDVQKLLKILFEDESNEMLGYYNSEDNFLMNLWALQMFSNSMLYFDCRLNFEKKSFNVMDMKNVPFLTKHEMIVMFFGRLKRENLPSHRLSDLMGKSTLRKIARSLKESNESHEMIPGMLFDANINQFVEYYISGYPKNLEFVEIHQITRLFDSNCDSDLMLEAVLVIHQETLSCSISEKQDYYSKVYRDLSYWKEVIPKFFEENNWFHEKYPVVQGLYETHKEGDESKFLIAKELENALEIAMRKRYSKPFPKGLISIETEEEQALFGHTSPISTPYGTFCRLALNSFIMLFDEVTNGMNLFRRGGLKKENFPKIIEWFTNFTKDDQLFSANRNQRFLIETWKLEEIIDRAYIELEQFMTDPIQKLPKPPIEISYALKELCKWSEDCEDVCYQIKLAIEGDIHSGLSFNILLEHRRYVFNYILTKHSKIDKFCANQGFFLKVRYTSNPVADTKPVQVSASEMMKLREEEFMKILPTIPLHFEMTCKQLHKKIEENISKRGPVWYECEIEDQRKNLELFDKFMEFIDVAITKEHECYVKRKLIPSKREKIYHDSLFSDKKLLNTVLFQGGPFLKAYRERLEEIMYETDNEEVVKSITNALKNFEMFNFEPPV